MGICESITPKGGQTPELNQPSIIITKKPKNIIQSDEKSNDTMNYQNISLSFNSDTNIKKPDDNNSNDEKEKSTNYTNLQKINPELKNNSSKLIDINQNKSLISSNSKEGLSQNGSQKLDNSNILNTISGNYSDMLNSEKLPMNGSVGSNNLSNPNGSLRFDDNLQYGSNMFNRNNNINVSIHDSRFSKSALLYIPQNDNGPMINISGMIASFKDN